MIKPTSVVIINTHMIFNDIEHYFINEHGPDSITFSYDDFTPVVDSIMHVATATCPHAKGELFTYAMLVLTHFLSQQDAQTIINRYDMIIRSHLNTSGLSVYAGTMAGLSWWQTGNGDLYITRDTSIVQESELNLQTRDDIINSINRGDFISERIRKQYGL